MAVRVEMSSAERGGQVNGQGDARSPDDRHLEHSDLGAGEHRRADTSAAEEGEQERAHERSGDPESGSYAG